jgi:hypothetical protein
MTLPWGLEKRYVCYWHLADIPATPAFVRYWTNSGQMATRELVGVCSTIPGILQFQGFWYSRDSKYWRRCRASDANSLLNGTGNLAAGTGIFAWQKLNSSTDEIFRADASNYRWISAKMVPSVSTDKTALMKMGALKCPSISCASTEA